VNPAIGKEAIGNEAVAFFVLVKIQVGERCFAAGFSEVVENLVFQDARQPAFFGSAPGKFAAAPQGGEECFLHHVLGEDRVTETHQRKSKQAVAMLIDPRCRVRKPGWRRTDFGWSRWIHNAKVEDHDADRSPDNR
jgi:hypothetical protein